MKTYPCFQYDIGEKVRIMGSHHPWKILYKGLFNYGEGYVVECGYTTYQVPAKDILAPW